MARPPRYRLPGMPQLVAHRGSPGRPLFCGEQDYRFYLDSLAAASRRYRCAVHAYVLLPDQVLLLLTPEIPDGVTRLMQTTGRHFVHYNKQSGKEARSPWAGRYRSTVIEPRSWLLTCYRYIEQAPVYHQQVATPDEHPWSSYGLHALGGTDPLVLDHPLYTALATDDPTRRERYRDLCRTPITEPTRMLIRGATNAGWALGSERFQNDIEKITHRRVRPLPRGGYRRRSG